MSLKSFAADSIEETCLTRLEKDLRAAEEQIFRRVSGLKELPAPRAQRLYLFGLFSAIGTQWERMLSDMDTEGYCLGPSEAGKTDADLEITFLPQTLVAKDEQALPSLKLTVSDCDFGQVGVFVRRMGVPGTLPSELGERIVTLEKDQRRLTNWQLAALLGEVKAYSLLYVAEKMVQDGMAPTRETALATLGRSRQFQLQPGLGAGGV